MHASDAIQARDKVPSEPFDYERRTALLGPANSGVEIRDDKGWYLTIFKCSILAASVSSPTCACGVDPSLAMP